jgi:hypothetical protein
MSQSYPIFTAQRGVSLYSFLLESPYRPGSGSLRFPTGQTSCEGLRVGVG